MNILDSSILLLQNEILPFATQQGKIPGLRLIQVPPPLGLLFNVFNYIFCPMQLQMVIFDFTEEGAGTEHVAVATLKCIPSGIFLRMQHSCQISIALFHYWRRYSWFCVTSLYLHNRWRHHWLNLHNRKTWTTKEKRKTPFFSKKPFKLAYFWNDLFFGSYAL